MDAREDASARETAAFVLQYLTDSEFTKTTKSFKREAKQLLQRVGQLPRGLKPLGEIISEYVALKEAHLQREQLLASNAALRDVFHVIESHAAAVSQAAALQDHTLRQQPGATPAPAGQQRKRQRQSTAKESQGGSAEPFEPPQDAMYGGSEDAGFGGDFNDAQPGDAHNSISPRKTLRKRAPRKRKKAAAAGEAAAQLDQAGDGYGASMMDLLNLPINERALESLLAGEWQGRFAEGLASCINGRLGPQQQQELEQLAAQEAAAGLPMYDEAEMNTWMESLTGDPGMAALLEPIVAPSQDAQGSDHADDVHVAVPDDMQLAEAHDGGPLEQPPADASLTEPDHAQPGSQQEGCPSTQEPDQAAPAAARELPPQPPVQASAQKARRRLSLEPTAFTAATALHSTAPEQLPQAQPHAGPSQAQRMEHQREASGAVSAGPDAAAAATMRDELFAPPPGSSPAEGGSAGGELQRRGQRRLSAEARATPKLSAFLADPMSTLDGFPAHILAAKTAQPPQPAAQPALSGGEAPSESPPVQQAAEAQRNGRGSADVATPAPQLASREGTNGFFSNPISTLAGFPGDILRHATGGLSSFGARLQPQGPDAQTSAGGNVSTNTPPPGEKGQSAQQGNQNSATATTQPASRERSVCFFGNPISTLDGFPVDILRETAFSFRGSAKSDAAIPPPAFSNLSFLDAMPTVDGFSRGASPGEASGQLPGSGAAGALSPIPLRLAADGWLSNGLSGISRHDDLPAAAASTFRDTGAAAAAAAVRQGREDARSFQERGIWRTEESMDAVLNQDAFEEPSSAPTAKAGPTKQVTAADKPAAAAAQDAAKDAAPTDFRGLQARISGGGAALAASTCAQQQAGSKATALGGVFAGGASVETLDAFMRSLKY